MIQSKETRLFMEKLFRFNKLIHHQVIDVTECPQSECKMLGIIHGEIEKQERAQVKLPGVPISKLSKLMLHSKPATSRILRTLEEKNCIIRIPSKTDRRTVYVRLTEKGKRINEEMTGHVNDYMNQILLELGPEDTEELLRLMDRLYEVVADLSCKKCNRDENNNTD